MGHFLLIRDYYHHSHGSTRSRIQFALNPLFVCAEARGAVVLSRDRAGAMETRAKSKCQSSPFLHIHTNVFMGHNDEQGACGSPSRGEVPNSIVERSRLDIAKTHAYATNKSFLNLAPCRVNASKSHLNQECLFGSRDEYNRLCPCQI